LTERWLPVVGFEGFYEVSDNGQVRSFGRWKWNGKTYYWLEGRTLVRSVDGRGYLNVNLVGKRKVTRTVHSLVAEAFIGPLPEGFICCHNDDNKNNCALDNLRYDTHAGNVADTYRNGIRKFEDNSPRAKKAAFTRFIKGVGIARRQMEHDL